MNPLRHLSPHELALLAFILYFLVIVTDVRHFSRHDPESVFFDPDDAFVHRYTAVRQGEAGAYISAAENSGNADGYVKAKADHSMCVGIATRRVGSVLAGLTRQEREDIALVNFIVNIDPNAHQAYNESWLPLVSDRVLTYADADEATRQKAIEYDSMVENRFLTKPLFDYIYLLQTCYDDGAEWIVMLEDDTLAAEGWYLRTKDAAAKLKYRRRIDNMIFLRLFANEGLLGWNSEEWPAYLFWSVCVEALVLGSLMAVRKLFPASASIVTSRTILVVAFAITPMSILLYFGGGRLTMHGPRAGITRMTTMAAALKPLSSTAHGSRSSLSTTHLPDTAT